VRALGYDIDNRHDARGRDLGFEIRGVSEEPVRTYSRRSQQRDQAIETFTEQRGRRPTDNEVAILVRDSRPDKLIEISPAEVKQRQVVRLTPDEAQTLTELRQHAVEIAHEREGLAFEPAAHALRILERESGLRSVSLTQVQRQTSEVYRQAIEALREHPARGSRTSNRWERSGRWRGRIGRGRWPRRGGRHRPTGTRTASRARCWSSARRTTTSRT
jgi:hypothetical protein